MEKVYFTLREVGNEECPNIGTIETLIKGANIVNDITVNNRVKEAIASHFDAEVIDCSKVDLTESYNAYPVKFKVKLDVLEVEEEIEIEVEQTWLYQ